MPNTDRPSLVARFNASLTSAQALAMMPAISLGAFALGGQTALIVVTVGLPALIALFGAGIGSQVRTPVTPRDGLTGLALRQELIEAIDRTFQDTSSSGHSTACLVVDIDDLQELTDKHGRGFAENATRTVGERLRSILRDDDVLARLDGGTFAIMLSAVQNADLETVIQIASRIQAKIGDSITLNRSNFYISSSVGFCLASRAPEKSGIKLLMAAESALIEARRNGPGAIRSYSKEMRRQQTAHDCLVKDARVALELGQISAWFQPQISTDTGEVTGFEALARWTHPDRGLIPPVEFLPALEEAGLSSRLGEVMLNNALTALKNWDTASLNIPSVAVNFSDVELRDPKLMEKIKWELDRFELTPERLTIEILESVVADSQDDTIPRNIAMLSDIGCQIDLDDFGTGHASIASIRQFAVNRIKIDRSFVTKVDEDQSQQKMLSAILMMAERLELDTLAEGVESLGESSMLAQLGCAHVQGFGIARPMPYDETLVWVARHNEKLRNTPQMFGAKTGQKRANDGS